MFKQIIARLRTRSLSRVFLRIFNIAARYGMTRKPFIRRVAAFIELCRKYQVVPTFPITAVVVKRHMKAIRQLQALGAEFAIHGFRHLDHTHFSLETFDEHVKMGKTLFDNAAIKNPGFRFPYLRRNEQLIKRLGAHGVDWDSSDVIVFDSVEQKDFRENVWTNYLKILDTYNAVNNNNNKSLPFIMNSMVEIPVSVPDDDMLIERLEIHDIRKLSALWLNMFMKSHNNEEMFVMQLHPERFDIFKEAVDTLLNTARTLKNVWLASLGEIAGWWKKRDSFYYEIEPRGMKYTVRFNDEGEASIAWNSCCLEGLKNLDERTWEINKDKKPFIGMAASVSKDIINGLRREGYRLESSEQKADYPVYISEKDTELAAIMHDIENSQYPVPKFNRWPRGFKSALAITGDIDCIDLWDFFNRVTG